MIPDMLKESSVIDKPLKGILLDVCEWFEID